MGLRDRLFAPRRPDLAGEYKDDVKAFLAEHPDAQVQRAEIKQLREDFIAARLPQGEAAVAQAKAAGLFKIRESDYMRGGDLSGLKGPILASGYATEGVDHYNRPYFYVERGKSWADVIAFSPEAVKGMLGLPADADPEATVIALAESLVETRFMYDVSGFESKRLERHNHRVAREGDAARKRAVEAEPNPYAAAIERVGRPDLSDLGESAAVPSAAPDLSDDRRL